jgi:hypothetical protein
MLALAGVLLVVGGGIIAAFIINPAGEGDMWVMPLVGGAFALVGLVMLYGGVRGARGMKIPPAEVFIEGGAVMKPGATVRLRVRQGGPMAIESLTVKACCERVYRRKVKPNSSTTVEDRDGLWEQVVLEVVNERVPAGGVLEREAAFTLPASARPTGPAKPDGRIEWRIQVWGEAGFMRATYGAFRIAVQEAPSDAAVHARPAIEWPEQLKTTERPARAGARDRAHPVAATAPAGRESRLLSAMSGRAGCFVFGVPFLLVGSVFLWMFFNGAAFRGRGNPYMALFGGALFALVGLVAIVVGVMSLLPARRRRSPRRS